jgi:dTDP-4-amino-4,6-dideoxygalactose transaminase
MVVTDDETLAERLRSLRNHGAVRSDDGWHFEAAGYNYRLSDILAAVGVVQFRKLPSLIDARRKLAGSYRTLLGNVDDIQLPVDPGWGTHIYQSFVILLPNAEMRPGVMSRLAERGIETTIGTYALHAEPFFARSYGYQAGDMPRSYDVARRALSLPLYPRMTLAEQTEVAEELVRAIGQAE